jgi:hypothetical protein
MPAQLRSRRRGDVDSFLRCRTYGHAWDEFTPIDLEAPWYGWRLSLRCIRCSTERHDNISYGTNVIMGRQYVYPDGYKIETGKDGDRPTKEIFRDELFTQLRSQLRENNQLGSEEAAPRKGAKKSGATITPIKKATKKRTAKAAAKKVRSSPVRKRA